MLCHLLTYLWSMFPFYTSPPKKKTTKRQENRRFSGVFNVYKMQILTRNELRWINQNQYDQNKITYIV